MNKQLTAVRWGSLGASVLSLAAMAGCATTSGRMAANGPSQDSRACSAGVALVTPASQLRGETPADGRATGVLNVDGNDVRGVQAANGYSVRARSALNSDVGRGNQVENCAF